MVTINISEELMLKCPQLTLGCILCNVEVKPYNELLWIEIERISANIRQMLVVDDIGKLAPIAASRRAYKACGKDPARYRLSAEALLRRIVKGESLYQINNVVDIVNLVSVQTGFSIGGYDYDKIDGDITFGIGKARELYTGLGRGELNIDGLPVFRDSKGAFGSPTSDSERTGVSLTTQRFLMVVIGFSGEESQTETIAQSVELLTNYALATNVEVQII